VKPPFAADTELFFSYKNFCFEWGLEEEILFKVRYYFVDHTNDFFYRKLDIIFNEDIYLCDKCDN